MRAILSPRLRDAAILLAIAAILAAIVWPAMVSAQESAYGQPCLQNVHQLNLAVLEYTQDNNQKLPQFDSPALLAAGLQPHTKIPVKRLLKCPITQRPYTFDSKLSRMSLAALSDKGAETQFVQDSVPHKDGKSTIGYITGTVTYGGADSSSPGARCLSNVTQISHALLMYSQDYHEKLPVYTNAAELETALAPYAKGSKIFTCPETSLTYTIDTSLSGKFVPDIKGSGKIIVAQDASPHKDGKKTTAYLDGTVIQSAR